MNGLLFIKLILLSAAVAHSQDFIPIDSFELPAEIEDYFSNEQTSRSGDDYPLEYDSDEEEDDSSSLDYDPTENEALFDNPSRPTGDRKQKRQDYFDGLTQKVHRPLRKDLDLMAGASDQLPRPRSRRNRRARMSDYDLYYPKRTIKDVDERASPKPKPQSDEFDFEEFFKRPIFDSRGPASPGFNDEREPRSQTPYDEPRQPSSDSPYRKSPHPSNPRAHLAEFDDDIYRNRKPLREYRKPTSSSDSYSYPKPSLSVEARRPSPDFEDDWDDFHSNSKSPHSAKPSRPNAGLYDDVYSYRKPSESTKPRRPLPEVKDDFYNYPMPTDSGEARRPNSGFNDDYNSYRKSSHYIEPRRPNSGFTDDYKFYPKPSHSVEPRKPSPVLDYFDDSFKTNSHSNPAEPKRPAVHTYSTDFDIKAFLDEPMKPSSEFTYPPKSYPAHPPTESSHKKTPAKKIRQRSKRIETKPYKLPPLEPDSMSHFFSVPKTKHSSSRSAAKERSSPRKLSDVQGRSAMFDDDLASRPAPFKKASRRRPGLFSEEKELFLSGTGKPVRYGKPVREQFHEQDTKGPDSYKFGYNTGDKDNPMARYEERSSDGLVKGSYSYVDPLGKLKVVHYESHPEHGFKTTRL
ncbi:hypothetical protein JTE90_011451 [Oedothorax gibbosus]|uniref:Uncharacterized protein n=1 Tax=Oedothorax gibbosus TaxID=931172 RepID=A0AAV6VCX4_9ARAC|nr:hypothetical protein JTE90_011451 [Oedothorax gibbosus]